MMYACLCGFGLEIAGIASKGQGAADTSWQKIVAIIVTNMLGTGVLSLPFAFAKVRVYVC